MDFYVVLFDYMEYNGVVGGVGVVVMSHPVGGTDVYFDVSHPRLVIDFHLCVEKIRARIGVQFARVDDDEPTAISGH